MPDDPELLRRYAEDGSEEAFAELVRRHLNLVYFASLRRVGGDAHLAEDVTQQVFTALARNAPVLSRRPVLAGWLYTTSRFAAAQVVRAERRRHNREQEAQTMHELTADSPPQVDWDQLRPVLDTAMDDLNESDREAVLLRFFEARPFADIGAKLRLSEDAARMRVERALDKLRALLTRRGVTSTTTALGLALESQAGAVAPIGLASSVTGAALIGAAAAPLGGGAKFALKFLYLMNTKTTAVMGVAALLAGGAAFYESAGARKARADLATAITRESELNAKFADLQQHQAATAPRVTAPDQGGAALRDAAQNFMAAGGEAAFDALRVRFREAQALAQSGRYKEALQEFWWCYDFGLPHNYVLREIEKLAQYEPEALAALRARRDQAAQQAFASPANFAAMADFSGLNRALKEEGRTLEFYDGLPANDGRRREMRIFAYTAMADAQRYAEAAAVRPYRIVSSVFETLVENGRLVGLGSNEREALQKDLRNYLVPATAQDIEVMAGAGDLAHARALAEQLLVYDNSNETRALLQKHLERAGHPELMTTLAKP